jgi:2-methylisocitrate lyase-like PEP mutase family enzyme
VLQALGFPALATTSAGFAQTLGRADGQATLEEKIDHCARLAQATSIPITVDFEDGYARNPDDVGRNVLKIAATGVAGCSIEDFNRETQKLIGIDEAVERLQAAAEAVATLGMPFMLTARAENLLRGVGDLDEAIRRLQAYEQAGADVLYAPALKTLEDLERLAAEVTRPINALGVMIRGATVAELADAGAKRISVGNALASLAMGPVIDAGREMLERGTFGWLAAMPSDLSCLMKD